jgi:hypothetical protein
VATGARSHGVRVEVELVDMLASEERVALVMRERSGSAARLARPGVVADPMPLAVDPAGSLWVEGRPEGGDAGAGSA